MLINERHFRSCIRNLPYGPELPAFWILDYFQLLVVICRTKWPGFYFAKTLTHENQGKLSWHPTAHSSCEVFFFFFFLLTDPIKLFNRGTDRSIAFSWLFSLDLLQVAQRLIVCQVSFYTVCVYICMCSHKQMLMLFFDRVLGYVFLFV